jgi:hypothetical protein
MEFTETGVAGFESTPYYVCFGVTGHRKLKDRPEVEAAVKKAIDVEIRNATLDREIDGLVSKTLRRKMGPAHLAGVSQPLLRVLSPLAEGADRAVARAVLSYPGAQLEVVLPMVLEDYLEDFTTAESRREFTALLSRCPQPVALRTLPIRDQSQNPAKQAELRREAYSRVGQYVVDHCDVLIAVWDGEPSRGRGGTAEIVHYAQKQDRPVLRVWEDKFEA